MSTSIRTFTVDFTSQAKDNLITSEDIVSFLKSKMKVKNCLKIAAREISFVEEGDKIKIESKEGNIQKDNLRQYLKRYLRTKALKNFVKVSGDDQDGFKLVYINPVNEDE